MLVLSGRNLKGEKIIFASQINPWLGTVSDCVALCWAASHYPLAIFKISKWTSFMITFYSAMIELIDLSFAKSMSSNFKTVSGLSWAALGSTQKKWNCFHYIAYFFLVDSIVFDLFGSFLLLCKLTLLVKSLLTAGWSCSKYIVSCLDHAA